MKRSLHSQARGNAWWHTYVNPSPIPRMIKHTKGEHYKDVETHYLTYNYGTDKMVVTLLMLKGN